MSSHTKWLHPTKLVFMLSYVAMYETVPVWRSWPSHTHTQRAEYRRVRMGSDPLKGDPLRATCEGSNVFQKTRLYILFIYMLYICVCFIRNIYFI